MGHSPTDPKSIECLKKLKVEDDAVDRPIMNVSSLEVHKLSELDKYDIGLKAPVDEQSNAIKVVPNTSNFPDKIVISSCSIDTKTTSESETDTDSKQVVAKDREIEELEFKCIKTETTDHEPLYLSNVTMPKMELPIIKVMIGEKSFRALIDSGASHVFMSKECAKIIDLKCSQVKSSVTLADGSQITNDIDLTESFTMNIAHLKYTIEAVVLSQLNGIDIILGMSWLRSADPTVQWSKARLHLQIGKAQARVPFERSKNSNKFNSTLSFTTWSNFEQGDILFMVNTAVASAVENSKNLNSKPLEVLLKEYDDIFPEKLPGLPPSRDVTHSIDTGDAKPISQNTYQMSPRELEALKKQLDELLELGFIRPSSSPWSSPVLFVKKKDGSLRLCVDYRALNAITKKDSNPVPRINELLDILGKARYFSKLDLLSGYHQVLMDTDSIEKTGFKTRYGHFEYLVVPFGLTNAPPTFMRAMNNIFHDVLDKFVILYLDDILIFSETEQEHLEHLKIVFEKFRKQKLYAKKSKCEFMMTKISFLGHTLSEGKVAMDEDKVKAIREWKTPKSATDVRSFIGLAGYYHRFVEDFAEIAAPLYKLMTNDQAFVWDADADLAFKQLIEAISSAPVLRTPDFSRPFIVTCDASINAVGGVLSQVFDDGDHPIAFLSHKLSPAETNYPVHELELLAIYTCVTKWRCYLEGSSIVVRTDHASLALIRKQKTMSRRMFRWISTLEEYGLQLKIEYQPGRENVVADALSRMNLNSVVVEWPDELLNYFCAADKANLNLSLNLKQQVNKYKDRLRIQDDNLQFLNDFGVWVAYIPFEHRADVVYKTHHDLSHIGHEKVRDCLERRVWWPSMKVDIKKWLESCVTCQRENARPATSHTLYPLPVVPLFCRWNLDFVGPLVTSRYGNTSVLVAVEFASKWVIAKAVKHQLAEGIVDFIEDEIIQNFGVPVEIITDQGRNFLSDVVAKLTQRRAIIHKRTTAYHPQTNGGVERVNKTLISLIRKVLIEKGGDWEDHLAKAVFTTRITKHASTGFSPFEILFGQQPRIRGDMGAPVYSDIPGFKNINYLNFIREISLKNIKKSQTYNKRHRESKFRKVEEEIRKGDLVLIQSFKMDKGLGKLAPKWSLPHLVLETFSNGTVRLKELNGTILPSLVHRNRLAKVKLP